MKILKYANTCLILLAVLTSTSIALNTTESCTKPGKMCLDISDDGNTITILREGRTVVVYQKNTSKGQRSIANAITELYTINHTNDRDHTDHTYNLVNDSSAIVPPQSVVRVKDEMIQDDCQNEPCKDPNYCACDYFAHNNVSLDVKNDTGDFVRFVVNAKSTQHDNNATPINYTTEMTITVPYNEKYVVIEYNVTTALNQELYLGHSIRPLPFFEIVNHSYKHIAYSNSSCLDETTNISPNESIPANEKIFINNATICLDQAAWAAMYDSEAGNLGMILQSWNWPPGKPRSYSGEPRLYSSTEGKGKPNLYFQSNDTNRIYESGKWEGKIIFIAYTDQGYLPVKQYAENLSKNSSATSTTDNLID
jgi:hypothetical protein